MSELYSKSEWQRAYRYAFDSEDKSELRYMELRQRAYGRWMHASEKVRDEWFDFDTWFDRIGRKDAMQSMESE